MGNYAGDVIICSLTLLSLCLVYGTTHILKFLGVGVEEVLPSYSWIVRLSMNILGYSTILLPGYLIHKYARHSKYLQRGGQSCVWRLSHKCFHGGDAGILDSPYGGSGNVRKQRSLARDALLLTHCFVGLQTTYLTWGYLQEKIMTQPYVDENGTLSHFEDTQFLVFVNRVLAFVISGTYLLAYRQPKHNAPLYKYAFCSLSNIMSSWCQYEALKYVSFPTQVLGKASKVIPVMIMGKIVSRATYEYYEYVTAVLISIGMTLFMLGSTDAKNDSATTLSGVILLCAYLMLDSFTSNWQNAIFTEYNATSVQMMCAVNMFSCLLTVTSLLQQSSFEQALPFMKRHPNFVLDCFLISCCSAVGQLYIFYTISKFGAVTFTIIMAIRQALAVLLSCLIYHHSIAGFGVFGVLLVFGSVFLRIYCNGRLRAIRKRRAEAAEIKH